MCKWLVTGSEGFIGSHLCSHLAAHHEVLGTYKPQHPTPKAPRGRPLDILHPDQILPLLDEFRPDCVVHLAGSKDVNWCEKNPQAAHRLNAESVRHIASACGKAESFLVFLSSDYVFEGTEGAYALQSACRPMTVYGKNKLDAEQLLAQTKFPAAVVRTAGVYAGENPPTSLLGWAGNLLKQGTEVSAFENVFNSPTFVGDLIKGIETIGTKKLQGLFHLAGASRESRHSFLSKFARQFGFGEDLVKKSLYTPAEGAKRPLDISLDSASSYRRVGFGFCDAEEGLKAAFSQKPASG